jgi:hypothetical protein
MSVGLVGLGLYFAVQLGRGLRGYARFERVRPTAVVTWPVPRPPNWGFLLGMGVVSLFLTALNGYLARPLHHVASLLAMSLYFIGMVPLARRIRLGLYRDGVWADAGFLAYSDIGRFAFRETPEIVLLLVPRGSRAPFRLPVPPGEYGAVRKHIEDKVRSHAVNVERSILGLEN